MLDMPDGRLEANWENKVKVIQEIRAYRPRLVLAPYWITRHPDHSSTSQIVREASYLAGLKKLDTRQEAHRPFKVIFYPTRFEFPPSFIVDISDYHADKLKALAAYKSQFDHPQKEDFGAAETLLVDEACASTHLGALIEALIAEGCEVRGDEAAQAADPRVKPAADEDWATEYLDAVIAVKVVSGLDEAIAHIEQYGSHHTDAIIADDLKAAQRFLREVDSAIVMHNASTQFADGGQFGMGAEIGIATGRFHARGPVGVEQLTTFKYCVSGSGQVRPA